MVNADIPYESFIDHGRGIGDYTESRHCFAFPCIEAYGGCWRKPLGAKSERHLTLNSVVVGLAQAHLRDDW